MVTSSARRADVNININSIVLYDCITLLSVVQECYFDVVHVYICRLVRENACPNYGNNAHVR